MLGWWLRERVTATISVGVLLIASAGCGHSLRAPSLAEPGSREPGDVAPLLNNETRTAPAGDQLLESPPVGPKTDQVLSAASPATDTFVVNGITFKSAVELRDYGCASQPVEASSQDMANSALRFEVAVIPEGYTLRSQLADACDGHVISWMKAYRLPGEPDLLIRRWSAPVHITPSSQPEPVVIAGRKAVRIQNALIIVEPFGITRIDARTYEEALSVAAGIR